MWKKPANIIVLVLFVGMLGLMWWVQQNPAEPAELPPVSTPLPPLFDLAADDVIVRLTVTDHVNDRFVSLVRQSGDDDWLVLHPDPEPASTVAAYTTIAMVRPIFVRRTLTETTDLTQFGVLDPGFTIEVALESEEVFIIAVGNELFDGDTFYVLLEGDRYAQIVNRDDLENLLDILDEPPVLVPTEEPLLPDILPTEE